MHKQTKYTHYFPKYIQKLIHALPNLFTTSTNILIKYYKLNKINPRTKQHQGYYFINKLTLLQCEDIETNPGPMLDVLRTHSTTHRQKARTYFIPNTIKLHPEYQHLANLFAPILKYDHPSHQHSILTFSHLHQYIQMIDHSPLPHILYAIITIISPSINTCNNILA